MKVLVVDNFDSFTYNLVQALGADGVIPIVIRNDAISPEQVLALAPDRILISPGPGGPAESGNSLGIIRAAAGQIPILGVCLGHQCIGAVYGCPVVRAQPVHGKVSVITHSGTGLFFGLPQRIQVARYHSLVLESVVPELEVTATTEDGIIMGIRHQRLRLEGVQFHPESFMTPEGSRILRNFLA